MRSITEHDLAPLPAEALTPAQRYQHDLQSRGFSPDAAQLRAVEYTQALYEALLAENARREARIHRLRQSVLGPRPVNFKGIYFWGGVGRGKTWLVDAFHECLPFPRKLRLHFHRFMQHVHQELKSLRDMEDPLRIVGDRLSARALVICFDEFHVSDITDAMLLKGVLEALFERGVTLVATSNHPPERLYEGGLQRERFLPAVALLKEHTHVVAIDSGVDYRMRYLDRAETWHHPLDERAESLLWEHFGHLAPDAGTENARIEVEGREIETVICADGVAWFEFAALCEGPRGPADYIEIARQFQTVLIGNVPRMDEERNDPARRFINLVDEFYDRNVRLIATAATEPEGLYCGRRLAGEFRRTSSRLVEMQSLAYLSRPHRA